MLLRIAAAGAVLAASAALPTSCAVAGSTPTGPSPAPTANPAGVAASAPAGTWRVEWPNTSRDGDVTSYSVTCTPTGGPGSWREVAVPADKGESYTTGDPCPTGPVLGSADCGSTGPTNVQPDNGETQAEAILLCGNTDGSYSQDESILQSVANQPGQ